MAPMTPDDPGVNRVPRGCLILTLYGLYYVTYASSRVMSTDDYLAKKYSDQHVLNPLKILHILEFPFICLNRVFLQLYISHLLMF